MTPIMHLMRANFKKRLPTKSNSPDRLAVDATNVCIVMAGHCVLVGRTFVPFPLLADERRRSIPVVSDYFVRTSVPSHCGARWQEIEQLISL